MTSQATQLHEDRLLILWSHGRELKYYSQLKLFWELNKLRCHPQVFGFDSSQKTLIHQWSHTQTSTESTQYTHIIIYIQKYIHSSPQSWLWYIASVPLRVRLLNKITCLALPVFFYIHSDCGSCGHRARFVHTYIIL